MRTLTTLAVCSIGATLLVFTGCVVMVPPGPVAVPTTTLPHNNTHGGHVTLGGGTFKTSFVDITGSYRDDLSDRFVFDLQTTMGFVAGSWSPGVWYRSTGEKGPVIAGRLGAIAGMSMHYDRFLAWETPFAGVDLKFQVAVPFGPHAFALTTGSSWTSYLTDPVQYGGFHPSLHARFDFGSHKSRVRFLWSTGIVAPNFQLAQPEMQVGISF